MKPVFTFHVLPSLPPRLAKLREVAYNLRWAWDHESIELFRRLDSELWERTHHNPVLMLGSIDQQVLKRMEADQAFLAHLDRVSRDLEEYLSNGPHWFTRLHGKCENALIAYFSAEFGLTECLSIFAGGLGVLSGDHLKSASDLGVPLVGVGLLYQQGYFKQYLNPSGWQQEEYIDNDFDNLPVSLERRSDGSPLTVSVEFEGRTIHAQVWRVRVGRVPLILLDTNTSLNPRVEDRDLTDQLYGGDNETRIRQEILLGIGGCRALEALGFHPTVYHMNEGHSAFLALERVRRLMQTHGLSFAEAREVAFASQVFTTHTPVEAGHDYFSPELVARHLGAYAADLGLSLEELMALGRRNPDDHLEPFCMTVLALRMAAFRNGVSKLHGKTSRLMWQSLWPGVPLDEIPIGDITNGVHFRSWISHEMNQLYDRYLGPQWHEEPAEQTVWRRVQDIPAEELWRTHERRRERLVAFARARLRAQLQRRGATQAELDAALEVLDPRALTIGFARRFATYKRATLLLRDVDRLARMLGDESRPVQIIYAGKAHPRDEAGKELIRQVVQLARRPEFRSRLVFLEDYDMAVARYLVQGADVWLNTPLRPREASGTSGMKAAANGVLNLSILDGWWDEAYTLEPRDQEPPGWSIGGAQPYENRDYQDQVEAQALYDVLEQDIIPLFYDRRPGGLPRRWISRVKSSIARLCYMFNTHRMVRQYCEDFYLVAHNNQCGLLENGGEQARLLAAWLQRIRANWARVQVEVEQTGIPEAICVGDRFTVRARVELGELTPPEVLVEFYLGRLNADRQIEKGEAAEMKVVRQAEDGRYVYQAEGVSCDASGHHGYTVRVLPYNPHMATAFLPGLITWAAKIP